MAKVRFVAIGASTGGPQAIEQIIKDLGAKCPPIVIVQHMPENFTAAFASRLDAIYPLEIKEAKDGDIPTENKVLIAPGGKQLELIGSAGYSRIVVSPPILSYRHNPCVDLFFNSVAIHLKGNAMGILLTGMGNDGAVGLLAMKEMGCPCYAQDKQTSAIWGMPGEAFKIGAVTADELVPIGKFAAIINKASENSR